MKTVRSLINTHWHVIKLNTFLPTCAQMRSPFLPLPMQHAGWENADTVRMGDKQWADCRATIKLTIKFLVSLWPQRVLWQAELAVISTLQQNTKRQHQRGQNSRADCVKRQLIYCFFLFFFIFYFAFTHKISSIVYTESIMHIMCPVMVLQTLQDVPCLSCSNCWIWAPVTIHWWYIDEMINDSIKLRQN